MVKKLSGRKFTAKELAERFGCSAKTVSRHASALFGKWGKRFETRLFDEAQVTAILESVKKSAVERRGAESVNLERSVQGMSIGLTPVLETAQLKDLPKNGKVMSLREIADITGAAYSTVAGYAQRAGWTENGKTTRLDEAQTTIILEAIRKGAVTNHNNDLLSSMEGVETGQSLDFQLALKERELHLLWKQKATQQEHRAIVAEAAYGREVLDHAATRELLSERETGLGFYQRVAESAGLAMSDRDDLAALYGRGR
jgi:DNA-binding CsgD family transcriptional regulator